MRTLLSALLVPAAVVATAAPAAAETYCETLVVLSGDLVRVCVGTSGECVVEVLATANPPGPRTYACQPYPTDGEPVVCERVVVLTDRDGTTICL